MRGDAYAHRRMSLIADSTSVLLIDHPACVYASERIGSAALAARRRVGSRRPYIWGRMRRRFLGALRRSQRCKRYRQRVQSGNRTLSAGYAVDPSLMSGGDRNRSRLLFIFCPMNRSTYRNRRRAAVARVVFFSSSWAVCCLSVFPLSGIARDNIGNRAGAMAAAAMAGSLAMAGASIVCAAAAAQEV